MQYPLPEPHASILNAYFTSRLPLEQIAAAHKIGLMDLVHLCQSEPLASVIESVQRQIEHRNYLTAGTTAVETLAHIAATSPDPAERRRAASQVLRFLLPISRAVKNSVPIVITLDRRPPALA